MKKRRDLKWKLRRIRDTYCFIEYFWGVALGRVGNLKTMLGLMANGGILIFLINKAFGRDIINLKYALIVMPFIIAGLIGYGIVDIKVFHITQKINEISTKYNPWLVRLIKRNKKAPN